MSQDIKDNEKQNNNKRILIIIGIVVLLIGAGMFGYYLYGQYNSIVEDEKASSIMSSTTISNSKSKNDIDFKSLQKTNKEIYAWIKVPGTKVNYPIVQSNESDDFYLRHSAMTKEYSSSGAIYTQQINSKKFDDPVTVIYGHNGYGDKMFTTLHKFENKEFFNKHKYFYIYTPKEKLTYEIVSAFKYDDRHIMNSIDFKDLSARMDFFNMIQNPKSTNKQVRTNLDTNIDIDNNIVVLSTCITNQKSNRYLVCGVLINNEQID